MKTVCIVGTLDTKGKETYYLKEVLERHGLASFVMDVGAFATDYTPDYSNTELLQAIGEDIAEIRDGGRSVATETLARAMREVLPTLYEEGRFQGVIALGGSGGTAIATAGMQQLPVGVPKLMISTMASGNTTPYVGTSDIMMLPSIVDVAGLNRISRAIFNNACAAMAGMLAFDAEEEEDDKPLVAASMFGLTTPAVTRAMEVLEAQGYEVLVFHATGTGGKTMESLVEQGFFAGVLDLTTTEWCDELFGGVLHAGPHRLEAAALNGVPQVVSLGALDMVNFGPFDTVPARYEGRNFYKHNPTVTLMRTNAEENRLLGKKIAEKLNMATRETVLLMPLQGLSGIDIAGGPFEGQQENAVLFETLRTELKNELVRIVEVDQHINDAAFAEQAAETLMQLMKERNDE